MIPRPLFHKPKIGARHRRRRAAIVRFTFETPHGAIAKGDTFRVEGHRELFRFERYVEDGATKTVECHGLDTGAHRSLYVGSRTMHAHGLKIRPYRLRPATVSGSRLRPATVSGSRLRPAKERTRS